MKIEEIMVRSKEFINTKESLFDTIEEMIDGRLKHSSLTKGLKRYIRGNYS
ncbi:MAG: hypothetical protein N2511_06865 [Thermodesulfovibrionales bacterium]|nr:hypothetical protein [Thermodesulfovibrionales bacterium]